MSARGFSLIEMLLACALFILVGGAIAALATPLRSALERAESNGQLEPAGRAALQALVADLREAGSDPAVGDLGWRLARLSPRVFPMRDLDVDAFDTPGGAIRVTRTPRLGAQAVLAGSATAADSVLLLDTASRCAGGAPSCNFFAGMTAVLYDAASLAIVTVDSAAAGRVVLTRPVGTAFVAGAVFSELLTTAYGTRTLADGSLQLVRVSTGGAEQPLLDNVVDFEVTADSADVQRIQRVAIRVRIEAAPAVLRGPAGRLFRRGGTATDARRWVPDVELRFTIALRNPPGVI